VLAECFQWLNLKPSNTSRSRGRLLSIIDRAGIRVKHPNEAITVAQDGSKTELADDRLLHYPHAHIQQVALR
jgi:hypothetical protein